MSTKKATILEEGGTGYKRKPCELTAHEVFQLMQAFTQGKSVVTDEDCLAVCRWAQGIKFGSVVLALVLEQRLRVTVEAGEVRVGLPSAA